MYEEGRTVISKNPLVKAKEELSLAHLVEIKGNDIGYSFPINKDLVVVGRSPESDLMLLSDSISRKHMIITKKSEGDYFLEDNNSTNGIYVNNIKVNSLALRDGDIINVGDFGFKFLNENNPEARYHQELYNLKNFDSLTGAYNKSYFEARLNQEIERVNRYDKELSFIILDIDFFKKVNDTYGHTAGDYVLKDFAGIIKKMIRKTDVLGRVGGEEFAILIPETAKIGAVILAEKLRRLVEKNKFEFKNQIIPITVSMGVVSISNFEIIPTAHDFVEMADKLLYLAKREGRNQVRYL